MAESPAHRFGQYLGNLVEELFAPKLQAFCNRNGLYLDQAGSRPEVRSGTKVRWPDHYGNMHQLDYVIEQGGSAARQGQPIGFIEVAWRRYTKHSKNKAQEIQGSVLPIIEADQFRYQKPFLGAVLAGDFTRNARTQLESLGFQLVYISYEDVVWAFTQSGVDIAYGEATPDEWYTAKLAEVEASRHLRSFVLGELAARFSAQLELFFDVLEGRIGRRIQEITVSPLYAGCDTAFASPEEAIAFLDGELPDTQEGRLSHLQIRIFY